MNTSAVNHGISSVCSIFTNWTIIGILWHTKKWLVYIPRNKLSFLYYLTILIFRSLRSLCIFMSSIKNIHRIESKPKFIFFLAFLLNSCWLFLKKTQTKRMILTTLKEKKHLHILPFKIDGSLGSSDSSILRVTFSTG